MLAIDFGADIEQVVVGVLILLIGAIFTAAWRLSRRLTKQDTDLALAVASIEEIKNTLAVHFGGNGGGIREAVNSLKAGQAAQIRRMDEHLESHVHR